MLTGPNVSTATEKKKWVSEMASYFDLSRVAAASAAEPDSEEVAERYGGASESTTVASRVRHRPFCYGTNVKSSGRFPSSRSNPDGSLVAGTAVRLRDPSNEIVDLMMARRPPSTPLTRRSRSYPAS